MPGLVIDWRVCCIQFRTGSGTAGCASFFIGGGVDDDTTTSGAAGGTFAEGADGVASETLCEFSGFML